MYTKKVLFYTLVLMLVPKLVPKSTIRRFSIVIVIHKYVAKYTPK